VGADALSGGAGRDTADASGATGNVTVVLDDRANGGEPGERDNVRADIEDIRGGGVQDTFTGSRVANELDGGEGEDFVDGRKGGNFARCASGARSSSSGAHLSQRRIRRLRASGRGRFRTRGRYSAATVRGTDYTVTDRCDGTLTTVRRGVVLVRDFRLRRTIRVRAGRSYLARARRG